jgi:uncharacterized membrane protein YuzA (DUF378 family)
MPTRLFALVAGIVYGILGIAGFIPQCLWRSGMMRLRMNDLHLHGGQLGGFLPVNWAHNIVYLLIGLAGMISFMRLDWSKMYAKSLFALAVLFTLIGLLPLGIGDVWGYLPLSGWNVPIHTVTAILAWYYGFVSPRAAELGTAA